MKAPEKVYHLVSFPEGFLKGWELYSKSQEEYGELMKTHAPLNMSRKGNAAFEKKKAEIRGRFHGSKYYRDWQIGGKHRGTFLDKQFLINTIKKSDDPYDIYECYYRYLLIETHTLNHIDGCVWNPEDHSEAEMWFEMDKNNIYQEIKRPICLTGTVGFL